jgi:ACR3 family arsenite efflux pump ArsB
MNWIGFILLTVAPVCIGYVVVWRTVLRDELKDMKLIRD